MLNKKEVAILFGVTEAAINKWIRERKIPYVKLPGKNGAVRFVESSLANFISSRTVKAKR